MIELAAGRQTFKFRVSIHLGMFPESTIQIPKPLIRITTGPTPNRRIVMARSSPNQPAQRRPDLWTVLSVSSEERLHVRLVAAGKVDTNGTRT